MQRVPERVPSFSLAHIRKQSTTQVLQHLDGRAAAGSLPSPGPA